MNARGWGIASYTLVTIWAFASAGYVASQFGVEGATIAAWVQAVGSIGAIWGAFAIGNRQAVEAKRQAVELQEKRQEEKVQEDRAAVEAVAELATSLERFIRGRLDSCERSINTNGSARVRAKAWRRLMEPVTKQLEAVPLHLHPYTALAYNTSAVIAASIFFLEVVDELSAKTVVGTEKQYQSLMQWHGHVFNHVNALRNKAGLKSLTKRKSILTPKSDTTSTGKTDAGAANGSETA